ncbi:hypothetical protein AMK59_5218, partial [Oryctes borbonicus]
TDLQIKYKMIHTCQKRFYGQTELRLQEEAVRENHFQREYNAWLGILDSHLIGPYFLPLRLNADGFLNFLSNGFYDLLDNISWNLRSESWLQLGGCPAHYARNTPTMVKCTLPWTMDRPCCLACTVIRSNAV